MNPTQPPEQQQPRVAYRSTDTATLLDLVVDETIKKQIVEMEIGHKRFELDSRYANVFASSKAFKDSQTIDLAMTKIEVGRSWGLGPADSMRYVYFVNGKPALENEIYASKMMDAGWSWETHYMGGRGPQCQGVILFISRNGSPHMVPDRHMDGTLKVDADGAVVMKQASVEFTLKMAQEIKVFENGKMVSLCDKSGPWSTGWRSNMMFWRSIAQMRREFCPNVLTGALTRDEAFDIADLEVVPAGEDMPQSRIAKAFDKAKAKRAAKEEATEDEKAEDKMTPAEEACTEAMMQEQEQKRAAEAEKKSDKNEAHTVVPEKVSDSLNGPPSMTLLKKINSLADVVGEKVFMEVLGQWGHLRTAQISTEAKANDILAELRARIPK